MTAAIRERSRSITSERRDENQPRDTSSARAVLRRHVRILFCAQFRRRIRIERARYIQLPADAAESGEDIGPSSELAHPLRANHPSFEIIPVRSHPVQA